MLSLVLDMNFRNDVNPARKMREVAETRFCQAYLAGRFEMRKVIPVVTAGNKTYFRGIVG